MAEREVRELNQKLVVFKRKVEEAQQQLSDVVARLMDTEKEATEAKKFLSSFDKKVTDLYVERNHLS